MIQELMSAYGGRLVIAVLGVAIGLVCLVGILWLLRGRSGPSPFVRGGRNRNPRLQVLDAAAVDTRRRLVLVRRDDVEHLIMIGGPTDIVVESGIRGSAPTARIQADAPVPTSASAAAPEPRTSSQARAPSAAEPQPQSREQLRDPSLAESALRETAQRQPPRPLPASAGAASEPRPEPPPVARPIVQSPAPAPVRAEPAQPSQAISGNAAASPRSSTPTPAAPSPVAPSPAAPVVPAPSLDDAASALDAVRGRVIQDRADAPKIMPITAAGSHPALQQAVDKPKILGSDFEQILEEEMENNLAARDAIPSQPVQPAPRTEPRPAPITGATADPSLQDEVARIFGELSVTRDK